MTTTQWLRQRPLVIGMLITLLALSFVAASRQMSGPEQSVFWAIYHMPESLRLLGILATQLGSAWVFLAFVALLLVIRRQPTLALLVLRNGVLAYFATQFLKNIVGRPRPSELLMGAIERETFVHGTGFPSGHTALITAVSLTLFPHLPRWGRWMVAGLIVLVGWSRIYLGVHAPFDVVGGFLLGVLVVAGSAYFPSVSTLKKRRK